MAGGHGGGGPTTALPSKCIFPGDLIIILAQAAPAASRASRREEQQRGLNLRLPSISTRPGKVLAGVGIGILSWAFVLALYAGGLLELYELKTYDQLCRWNAAPTPDEIVQVVVDQGSLEAGRRQGINWPWPRQMYAPIVQFCTRAGARAVAFDVLYTEPSAYGLEDDQLFAEALQQSGRVFLPVFLSRDQRPQPAGEDELLQRSALPLSGRPETPAPPYQSAVLPIPVLADQARGLGNVTIPPDQDGIYRRLPPTFLYRGRWLPSLGLSVFQELTGRAPLVAGRHGLDLRGARIPLDPQGSVLLTYYAAQPGFPTFSAFNVIQSFQALEEGGEPIYPLSSFRDKIVFVGFTAPGLFDLKSTPLSSVNPGMTIHATLLTNLLRREFRERISPPLMLALAALLAAAVAVAVLLVPSLGKLALLALACGGGLLLALGISFRHDLWIDGVFPTAALAAAFAFANAFSYATEGRQRRQIKQMFSHYMSEVLIQDLLKNPGKLRLGGERRVLTVLFSDLAGFTSLSEKLQPEEVVALLNRYLTAMTEIILASGGLIDKYEGDAIMAFWGAPLPQEDHAARACLAALDNQTRLAQLRQEFIQMGLPPVRARIGINTGEMIIGNMGSSQRFDFTVIGDSVNLASRLEGAGKEYGVGILVSEETCRLAADQVEARELDLLRVKGKEKPVRIYELLGRKGELEAETGRLRNLFAQGLGCYRKQRWTEAVSCFEQALALAPGDGPSRTFLARCRQFQESPPGEQWDGVCRLTSK